MLKKALSFLMVLCLLSPLFPAGILAEETVVPDITARTLEFYDLLTEQAEEMEVYTFSTMPDVPYIEAATIQKLLDLVPYCTGDGGYEIHGTQAGQLIRFIRENGASVSLDFENQEVSFDQYNLFFKPSFAVTLLDDVMLHSWDENGRSLLITRTQDGDYSREGHDFTINMASYDIPMYMIDEVGYMPLQAVSDILLVPFDCFTLYNGEIIILTYRRLSEDTPIYDLYYSREPGQVPENLARYNMDELCLAFDLYYGLKKIHNIELFSDLFAQTGLVESLYGTDPVATEVSLDSMIDSYFGDWHSGFSMHSAYAGSDAARSELPRAMRQNQYMTRRFINTRSMMDPDHGELYYREIGDTAIVGFDSFRKKHSAIEYYEMEIKPENVDDCISLAIYAHQCITRENSPIRNVVLDLSCNGGGSVDAATFIVSWFLGCCYTNLEDTLTGAQSTTGYAGDTNLDRQYTGADDLTGYDLYCLISPASFSCSTMVAALFENSCMVTLIGQTTGGGSCDVRTLSTATGAVLDISGTKPTRVVKNGSFYEVDQGIEPDVYLSKPSSFYDYEALVDMIHNLR